MALKSGRVGIHPSQVDPITGMLLVDPSGASDLSDLQDVDIQDPAIGQILVYDGDKWANEYSSISPTAPNKLATLQDVALNDLVDGQILEYNATSEKWENVFASISPVTPATLASLQDVTISSVSNDQILRYDSTASKWENETLSKNDIGLGNVDNTSDTDKPISTATQSAIDNINDMIASIETTSTASKSYAIGDQFIYNGQLVQATAAITQGATITVGVGGNCVVSDVIVDQINETHFVTVDTTGKSNAEALTLLFTKIRETFNYSLYNAFVVFGVSGIEPMFGMMSDSSIRGTFALNNFSSSFTRIYTADSSYSGGSYTSTIKYAQMGSSYSQTDVSSTVPTGTRNAYAFVIKIY